MVYVVVGMKVLVKNVPQFLARVVFQLLKLRLEKTNELPEPAYFRQPKVYVLYVHPKNRPCTGHNIAIVCQ